MTLTMKDPKLPGVTVAALNQVRILRRILSGIGVVRIRAEVILAEWRRRLNDRKPRRTFRKERLTLRLPNLRRFLNRMAVYS